MDTDLKVRENLIRRMAERQGRALEKCRRRDPRALGFGTYRLTAGGKVLLGDRKTFGCTLEEVERFLAGGEQ